MADQFVIAHMFGRQDGGWIVFKIVDAQHECTSWDGCKRYIEEQERAAKEARG